jgi:hypothetical protein
MVAPTWKCPLYAALIDEDLRCEIVGGPFDDIDDVLDACWDSGAGTDLEFERFFVIEMGAGYPVVRTFPSGAFPTQEGLAEAHA